MSYGVIEYNKDGKPKCELCGRHFNRVISHVRQKHEMNEREYKQMFGFDLKKGICSKESAEKSRDATMKNFDKCIVFNLLVRGEHSRFAQGSQGRTKDMVSEQTKLMLKNRLLQPYMVEAMVKSGRKLGLSNMGNIARWKKKDSI